MLGIIHFQSIHTKISLKLFANLEVEYRGLENIPKERKYLIAAKHQSLAEAIFLNDAIKRALNYCKKATFINSNSWFMFQKSQLYIC